jgi:hypothetical protein
MAYDRYPMWAAEQYGTSRLPTAVATLLLFAVMALVLVVVLTGLGVVVDRAEAPPRAPGSFCDEKAGRPGWDRVCERAYR